MIDFKAVMRRFITGDDADGQSVIILDDGLSASAGDPDVGGRFEIWEDIASGPLDPKDHSDRGNRTSVFGPRPGNV